MTLLFQRHRPLSVAMTRALFLLLVALADSQPLRLAFGSCSTTNREQPLWPAIRARTPDVFLWLGDIVYADTPIFYKWRRPATLDAIAAEYATQLSTNEYLAFISSGGRDGRAPLVTGVWDDHDLGVNDADVRVPEAFKNASQALLLDFLGESRDSPRRSRTGVYGAWDIEVPADGGRARLVAEGSARAPAESLAQRVRLVLLDVRTNRAPWGGASHDLLGAAQWAWLEEALLDGARAGAAVTVIGSGIQVIAPGDPPVTEEWARAPGALARLVSLLAHTRTRGAIFVSGDVHFAELNVASTERVLGYKLWELTSSGLTHSWGGIWKGSGVALATLGSTRAALPVGAPWRPSVRGAPAPPSFCASNIPWRAWAVSIFSALGLSSPDGSHEPGLCLYTDLNFGEMDISADGVSLRIWGEDGAVHLSHTVPLAELEIIERADALPSAVIAACALADLRAGMPAACAPILAEILPPAFVGVLRQQIAHIITILFVLSPLAATVAMSLIVLRALRAAPKLAPSAPPLLIQAGIIAGAAVFIAALIRGPVAFIADALCK